MIKAVKFISIFLFFSSSLSMAGTVIKIQNKGEVTTVLTDGTQAKMNMGGGDYVIVNYRNHSVKAVSPQKHQVMLMNIDDMPKGNGAPKVRTSIKKLGSGPAIAGYKTQKFGYTVKGKSCGTIYGSKDAYQLQGIKELFNAMRTMMEKQQAIMGGYTGMIDDCTLGDIEMSDHVGTIGVPMRTEEKGVVDSEVKSIKLNVNLPADTFVIPASYKTVTVKEQMQEMNKDMAKMQKQMQQYNPQMQQMMQQMQQSGQMSPQMMEQMRRAQEQMQQYQQR